MINFTVLKSSADMKRYYAPHGHDYWIEDRSQHAFFGGKLAERLGLGEFSVEAFHALCDGIDPRTAKIDPDTGEVTGDQLTPGRKGDKRAGYDVTVDGPKDLGVLMALGLDERIVPDVLIPAAKDLAALIERDAQTRVRIGKQDTDRHTGSVVYSGVLHTTSRPVTTADGSVKIDIQPHLHLLFHSVTWDATENRYKALQLQPWAANGAKEARPYYTAFLNARLAHYMQRLGYATEKVKDTFRVAGVPDQVRREFSQRTNKIEAVAAKLEKQKQEFMGDPSAKLSAEVKGRLGAHTREPKQPGKTWDSLLEHWNSRVSDEERQAVLETVARSHRKPQPVVEQSKEAVDWALQHLLERSSVVPERKVVTEALKHGLGTVTPEGVWKEMARPGLIRRQVGGVNMVTTKEVLDEERRMTAFAIKGRGRYRPLSSRKELAHPAKGDISILSPSQQAAIRHAWASKDRVTIIRGLAGTGKTTLAKTLLSGVDLPTVVLAPSAEASRGVLRREGFEHADTLARFLVDEKLQTQARNGLVVLDEASMAGARDVGKLFQLAEQLNARVLMLGDRRQHKSVARGDVLALLEDRAGLPVAEVADIKRQRGEYKAAVEQLARGDVAGGFRKLDALGWIQEGGHERIVDDYLAAVRERKSVLVVSPTHAEGEAVTARIRDRLKTQGRIVRRGGQVREEGRLKGEERVFTRLVPLHLTEAERAAGKFDPGTVLQLHRNAAGHRAGSRLRVGEADVPITPGLARASAAYREDTIRLSEGDTLRITANGKDLSSKHRLNNGAVYQVAGFTEGGDIRLDNGWIIDKEFQHIQHGYVVTSHAAQGKTVDRVLIAQGEQSFPASGKEQFYVSVSRGREQAKVYTSDKPALLDAVQREDCRILASELVRVQRRGIRERLKRHLQFIRQAARVTFTKAPEQELTLERA